MRRRLVARANKLVPRPTSVTYPLARVGSPLALPVSNGIACTLTLPPNDAPSTGTIAIAVPSEGVALVPYVPVTTGVSGPATPPPLPASAAIVATTNVAVTFRGLLVPACVSTVTAATPTTVVTAGGGFVDPANAGSFFGPSVVVTAGTGTSDLHVSAGARFPIGYR